MEKKKKKKLVCERGEGGGSFGCRLSLKMSLVYVAGHVDILKRWFVFWLRKEMTHSDGRE
jgi:hypothetical protein